MPIEPDLIGTRQTARPEDHERTDANCCEEYAERTSEKPQHRALSETLAHQPAATRAECHAHGEFPFAGNGAGEQQAGHIDARDQQHETDGAEE